MKAKVNWKSLGHSAKRWHEITLRNDSAVTSRGTRSPQEKGWARPQMWKWSGALQIAAALPTCAKEPKQTPPQARPGGKGEIQ